MRNLKRVLSLALALVMMLGMMIITSSAAGTTVDFADADEITNNEAVDVMVALGVIEGDGTNFNPTDILTREQAAKIICYMLMGPANAEKLAGASEFTDVAADRWSAPFIGYCATLGILAGNGDGTFNPTGELTGVAFGKMLLVALGYDAKIEGYVNNKDWATNIAIDMVDAGIAVNGVLLSAPLSRDNACQMALNTLRTDMVDYDNRGTEINTGDMSVVVGASKAEPVTNTSLASRNNIGTATYNGDPIVQFGEKYFPNLRKVGGNVNGYDGYTWMIQSQEVSDFVVTAKVLASTAKGIDITEAVDKNHKNFIIELDTDVGTPTNYDIDGYYLNGAYTAATDNSGTVTKIGYAVPTNIAAVAAKKGAVVEFIDNDNDGYANVINVIEKQAVKLVADPVVVTSNGKTTVTIASIGLSNADATTVVGYEDLKKDDVVLYWTSNDVDDGKTYIEKADYITGTVDGYKSGATGGDLIGGKYYNGTNLTVAGGAYSAGTTVTSNKNTYNFYLDNGGYILTAVQVTENAATNYAAVRQIAWVVPNTTGAIGTAAASYAEAKLVFTDGTSEVVKIDSIDGIKLVAAGTKVDGLVSGATHYTNAQAAASDLTAGNSTTALPNDNTTAMTATKYYGFSKSSGGAIVAKYYAVTDDVDTGKTELQGLIPENAFYVCTVNKDGSYALSSAPAAPNTDTFGALNNDVITGNTVKFDDSNVGNANTVFIYVTKDSANKDVYTVYTGIANVPTTAAAPTNNTTPKAVVKNAAGVATYVFAVVGDTYASTEDVVYVVDNTATTVYDANSNYYLETAVVNGVVTEIKSIANDSAGFYKVDDVDKDGIYTLGGAPANWDTGNTGIKSTVGNVLVTDEAIAYDEGTPAYIINKVGQKYVCTETTVEGLALDATDSVMYIKDGVAGTKAVTVYVVKVDENLTALTLVAGATAETKATVTQGDFFSASDINITGVGKMVKIGTITKKANTTIKAVTINGADAANSANWDKECALVAGDNTIVVTIEDDFSKALTVYEYSFTVGA